ncbi:Os02g0602900 [Oryza sativa Japonica Group]|jgi:hypothetical protein|uniref:Os02g0602900 protein n=1 Tax=Oryza sativa subsp. japonica TaxID=39947 RepID=B7EMY0_ORYSJ|nr:hypothetical protein EE612_012260 [Oryza sativa]BAG93727.1 unnamed protein product [Oryza sativa Japonica Group]BAS79633.1 Os02g0602900 [Oryza sativa Japonica Group]
MSLLLRTRSVHQMKPFFCGFVDFQRLRPMLVHRQVPRFSVLLGEVKWICRLVAGNIDLNLIHINYMLGAC